MRRRPCWHCRCVVPQELVKRVKGAEMRLMFKSFGLGAILLSMSACGVTYQSPSVRQNTDASDVRVVSLTTSSVGVANSTPYIPRSLPEVFYIGTGGASVQSVGAVPPPPFIPDERADALELRLPPPASVEPYRIGVGDVLLLATKSAASTLEEISGLLAIQNQRQGFSTRSFPVRLIPHSRWKSPSLIPNKSLSVALYAARRWFR